MAGKKDVLAGTWEENTYGKTYLKFENGKVQLSFDELCFTGTYKIDGDNVTIMLNSYSSPVVYHIVFDEEGRLNLLAGALKYVDMVRVD